MPETGHDRQLGALFSKPCLSASLQLSCVPLTFYLKLDLLHHVGVVGRVGGTCPEYGPCCAVAQPRPLVPDQIPPVLLLTLCHPDLQFPRDPPCTFILCSPGLATP